jgi:Ca2+-binding RTX toxin-like protein
MIEVKGTRSARTEQDPTDPLGLMKPAAAGSGLIGGFVVGLLGLAVYLRSFLWFEPIPAQAAEPKMAGTPEDEGSNAAPQANAVVAVASTASSGSSRSPEPEAQDDSTMTLPVVFGPFDSGIFFPALGPLKTGLPQAEPANSGLPPFRMKQTPVDSTGPTGEAFGGPDVDPADWVDTDLPTFTGGNGQSTGGNPAQTRNRAPQNTGPVYLGEIGSGAALAIAMSSLVANSSDADGDSLFVVRASTSSGALQARPEGVRFIADTDELGTVQITYQVTDGSTAVAQTAFVTVVENQFKGTSDADLLLGTEGRDRVMAFAGDDNIATFGGRDVVFGGLGDDNISGGAGRDTLYGDEGNDLISGGLDADWLYGGEGDDRLYGEAGDDHVQGDAGNDLLDGGGGKDTLVGGDGADTVSGGEEDDVIAGGLGNDFLSGDAGRDVQFGDEGQDTVIGGTGEDILFGGLGADQVVGGADNDVLSGDEGNDTLLGEAGADLISGGDGDDALDGGEGNDVLLGEAGHDTLAGEDGADTLDGGAGNDVFHAVADGADDVFDGNEGVDELSYAAETEDLTVDLVLQQVFIAGSEEDSFSSVEVFIGGSGDDTFIAGEGNATVTGNGGADTYCFVQGDTVEPPPSSLRITDFGFEDLVSLHYSGSHYAIHRAQRELEDRIEDLFEDFADRLTLDEPKLRYFHEWSEEYRRTVVEVDFDRDDTVDLTLTMDGELILDVLRQQI